MVTTENVAVPVNPQITYAGFWRRFAAHSFDNMILFAIDLGILSFASLESMRFLIIIGITFLYHAVFWIKYSGQTPGKQLMKIRVIVEGNKPMDWGVSFVRYIGYSISGIVFNLGFITAAFDKKKQGWHDKIAHTYVVSIEGQKPNRFLVFLGIFLPILSSVIFILAMVGIMVIAIISKTQEGGGNAKLLLDKDVLVTLRSTMSCTATCKADKVNDCVRECVKKEMTSKGKDWNKITDKMASLSGSTKKHDWKEEMKPETKKLFDEQQKIKTELDTLVYSENNQQEYINMVIEITDKRISLLKEATVIQPENAELWDWLGMAYTWRSSGTVADGIPYVQKAIGLDKENPTYVYNLGDLYYMTGKNEDAVLTLKKSIRMYPDYALPQISLARTYIQMKLYDEARTAYEKAITIFTKLNVDKNGVYDKQILDTQKELNLLKTR